MIRVDERRQYGLELHQQGDLIRAEALYREILGDDRTDGETWHYLAVLCGQKGFPGKVVECCDQALLHGYSSASVHANLALAQRSLGQTEKAKTAFSQALELNPTDLELTLEYVGFLIENGDELPALGCLNDAVRIFPTSHRLHNIFGELASQLNNGALAEAQFRHVVDLQKQPDEDGLGQIVDDSGNQTSEAWVNLGSILQMRGDIVSARRAYRQALRIEPEFDQIYWYLAQFSTDKEHQLIADQILKKAQSNLSKNSAPIQFAAAKIYHDAGQFSDAFAAYQRGNQLVRKGFQYDVEKEVAALDQLSSKLSALNDLQYQLDDTPGQPTPVFIVGLPRSGSTLIEQMLGRHPKVTAGGEIIWLQRFVYTVMKKRGLQFPQEQSLLAPADVTYIRDRYLAALKIRQHGMPFVTDKLPANSLLIPLIRQLFPSAIIVHAKRDLLETCWSCYRHLFAGQQNFAYDLSELGRYAKTLHRYIATCQRQWPESVLELTYEALIENPEKQIRSLLQLLNLEWVPACLAPQKTDSLIQTASAMQIREGISSLPHQNTEQYSGYLTPLLNALGPENSDPNADYES